MPWTFCTPQLRNYDAAKIYSFTVSTDICRHRNRDKDRYTQRYRQRSTVLYTHTHGDTDRQTDIYRLPSYSLHWATIILTVNAWTKNWHIPVMENVHTNFGFLHLLVFKPGAHTRWTDRHRRTGKTHNVAFYDSNILNVKKVVYSS